MAVRSGVPLAIERSPPQDHSAIFQGFEVGRWRGLGLGVSKALCYPIGKCGHLWDRSKYNSAAFDHPRIATTGVILPF